MSALAISAAAALVPAFIAGLGAREAANMTYLGSVSAPAERALAFWLPVSLTFHVCGAPLKSAPSG